MVKDCHQEHCSDSREDKHSSQDEGSPKEESFEAVQLKTGDRHDWSLTTHSQHSGMIELGP